MRIVLAPDSYKGSATAIEVCRAMNEGLQRVGSDNEVIFSPMADGGEGTVENLTAAYDGQTVCVQVTGPVGRPVTAKYGILKGGLCIIETAEASGLTLVEAEERNPLVSTTYGLGQIITDALDRGCRTFVIGLGGSATNDGGCGMAAALGYEFIFEEGSRIPSGGGCLNNLVSIRTANVDKRVFESEFRIACDVRNPLCGLDGASHVFGPQKGASEEMISLLDDNLRHLAEIIHRDLGEDVLNMPGAGAAGGLGAGAVAFLKGRLHEGVKIIAELLNLDEKIKGSDIVFTGEGRCDLQTLNGKAPYGVVSIANSYGIPSVIIAGDVDPRLKASHLAGIREIIGIKTEDMTLDYAKGHVYDLIADATRASFERFIREDGCSEL
ncbi:MAG: glycerate kinase [Lentihominibacter sp.]